MNLRLSWGEYVGITLDETTTREDIEKLWARVRTAGPEPARLRRIRKRHRAAHSHRTAPHQRLPHAPGVPQPPLRDRHAALHPRAVRQGPRAGPQHDPAGHVHHEAQRHQRDDPHHLARVRQRAPVRARRPAARLQEARRTAARLALPGHGLRRHQPAAQRRLAGRIRRPAGDPGLPRLARREPPQHLPDPQQRARHQPGPRADGRHDGGGDQVR